MAHISVPKKLEKQFRPSLTQGSVYKFANLIAVDTKQKAYIYISPSGLHAPVPTHLDG